MDAAKAYLPWGSGLGTFVPVYAFFEKPVDTILNTFANHAHNDAVELFLETGVLGLALTALFVLWLGLRSVAIWRSVPPMGAREVDWALARAATIIVTLILVHSLVDYPLRTGAMMAIMAFSCALLIEPLVGAEPVIKPQTVPKRTRHRRRPKLSPAPAFSERPVIGDATAEIPDVSSRAVGELWGSDIQWPEEWRKGSSTKSRS